MSHHKSSSFAVGLRLPLSLALTVQVAVVVAAFVAVIVVLSSQQKNEFEDSLYHRLRLQHSSSLYRIVSPLLERKDTFNMFVDKWVYGQDGDGIFDGPSDDPASATLERAQAFYNHFYVLPVNDPVNAIVSISNMSSNRWEPYYNVTRTEEEEKRGVFIPSTGEYRVPRSWFAPPRTTFNMWVVDSVKFGSVSNENAHVCLSFDGYPQITAACDQPSAFTIAMEYNSARAMGERRDFHRPHLWGYPIILDDPTIGGIHAVAYNRQIFRQWNDSSAYTLGNQGYKLNMASRQPDLDPSAYQNIVVMTVSFSIPHVQPLIQDNTADSSSKAAVFSRYFRGADQREFFLFVAGQVDFPHWDMSIIDVTKDYLDGGWEAGETPDPILNAAYNVAAQHLPPNAIDSYVTEMSFGDDKYIVSASRFAEAETDFNWLYVEYTPRKVFFEDSDRARLTGILIGVFGALVVLVVCILIWVAVRIPLRDLSVNMALAADLRNDEVQHSNPFLSELADVSNAFREMNAKLLAAVPFLPQSLLVRKSNSFELTRDDDDEDEEGDVHINHQNHDDSSSHISAAGRITIKDNNNKKVHVDGVSSSDAHSSSRYSNPSSLSRPQGHGKKVGAMQSPATSPLELRRVGVLVVNVLGYHDALTGATTTATTAAPANHSSAPVAAAATPLQYSPNQNIISMVSASNVHRLHAQLAVIVERCVSEERGIVDYFHGDRFVIGFNTARVCGNSSRNGAETATKIWDRFYEQQPLAKAFPLGLAMGLGVGRAVVGNHGTSTMQRMATVGPVFTEAVRLQEVMSRNVLVVAKSSDGKMGEKGNTNHHTMTNTTTSSSSLNPLIAGRCLVMGRTIQEIEMSGKGSAGAHCQIIGAVESSHFLPASRCRDVALQRSFAQGRNAAVMRPGGGGGDTVLLSARGSGNGDRSPLDSHLPPTTVLVAAVCWSRAHYMKATGGGGGGGTAAMPMERPAVAAAEADEWLYEMHAESKRNVFADSNALLFGLWTGAKGAALKGLLPPLLGDTNPLRMAEETNMTVGETAEKPLAVTSETFARCGVDPHTTSPVIIVDPILQQQQQTSAVSIGADKSSVGGDIATPSADFLIAVNHINYANDTNNVNDNNNTNNLKDEEWNAYVAKSIRQASSASEAMAMFTY